jgi:hypothetical protein
LWHLLAWDADGTFTCRAFSLFDLLGMKKHPDGKDIPLGELRPYHFTGVETMEGKNVCKVPFLYNDIRIVGLGDFTATDFKIDTVPKE